MSSTKEKNGVQAIYLVQFFEETGEVFWKSFKSFECAFELFLLGFFSGALLEVNHNTVNDFFEFFEILLEFRVLNSFVNNIAGALEFFEIFLEFFLDAFEWFESQLLQ